MYNDRIDDVSIFEFYKTAIQKDEDDYYIELEWEDDMDEDEKTTVIRYHNGHGFTQFSLVRFDINQICSTLKEAKEELIMSLFNFD